MGGHRAHGDGLRGGHERAVAQAGHGAGHDHLPVLAGHGQDAQGHGEADEAQVDHHVVPALVLHLAQHQAHDQHGHGVRHEEQGGTRGDTALLGVGVEVGDHARVADAHHQHEGADGQHGRVRDVAQGEL